MAQLSLLHRFSIFSLIALVVANIILGLTITYALHEHALHSAMVLTSQIVESETKKEFTMEELSYPKMDHYDEFSEKMKHITFGPDVVRVKIWSKDRMVIWSDDQRLVAHGDRARLCRLVVVRDRGDRRFRLSGGRLDARHRASLVSDAAGGAGLLRPHRDPRAHRPGPGRPR